MDKNDMLRLLENADDSIIGELTELCEPLDGSADERIFSMIEKKCVLGKAYSEGFEDAVEGVDVYMKKIWKKALTAAAAVIVLAGGAAGGIALLKSKNSVQPMASVSSGQDAAVFAFLGGNYENGLLYNTGGGETIEYYLDYETLEKSPMCAVPNCTHTISSCLAKEMGVNPVIYNDYVYYFSCMHGFREVPEGHQFYMSSKLYRARLDSSETELVCEFSDCEPDDWNSAFILMGNTLWFIGDDKNIKETELSKESHYMPSSDTPGAHFMCSIDLDTGEYINHGQICEEYRQSEYWEQCNGAWLKGIYNGKLQISLEYGLTDHSNDFQDIDAALENYRMNDPDETRVFRNYEYDIETGECVKTDRHYCAAAYGDTFVGCDFQPGYSYDLYVEHGGETHIFENADINVNILGDKLFMMNGTWIDMSDWSEHKLPEEARSFLRCGEYNGSYIFLNTKYKAFKFTEEELRGNTAALSDASHYFYNFGTRDCGIGAVYADSNTMLLDYDTMQKVPLCAVPNCNHIGSDCLANMAKYPVIYNNDVYFFTHTEGMEETKDGPKFVMHSVLKKASLDSSEVEDICEFTDAIPRNEETILIYKNKLYFEAYDPDIEADPYGGASWGSGGGIDYLCSIDLAEKKYKNYGSICYVEDKYPAADNSSHAYITGFYNGKIYIDYIFTKEMFDPLVNTGEPEWTYYNLEFDPETEQYTESDLPTAVYASGNVYSYLDEKNSKLHIIKNGEDNAIDYEYYTNSAAILNNKLFVNGGWVDISDMSMHYLEPGYQGIAYYDGCYILQKEGNKFEKLTEEELRAL